jgi:hypothetical protein
VVPDAVTVPPLISAVPAPDTEIVPAANVVVEASVKTEPVSTSVVEETLSV